MMSSEEKVLFAVDISTLFYPPMFHYSTIPSFHLLREIRRWRPFHWGDSLAEPSSNTPLLHYSITPGCPSRRGGDPLTIEDCRLHVEDFSVPLSIEDHKTKI
jgi:hypothetical protein